MHVGPRREHGGHRRRHHRSEQARQEQENEGIGQLLVHGLKPSHGFMVVRQLNLPSRRSGIKWTLGLKHQPQPCLPASH